MKIAFFLGAGASVCAGMPTTKTLMDGMRVKHQECVFGPILRRYANEDIEKLYGDVRTLLGLKDNKVLADLPIACAGKPVLKIVQNDEDGRPFFQLECKEHAQLGQADANPDLFEPTFEQLEALQLAARNHMFDTIRVDPRNFAEYENVFSRLREFAGGEHMAVITTNYDMLVEEYCSKHNIKVADGFERGQNSLRGTWPGPIDAGGYHVKLVKLHGSLNWHKNNDGEILCESAIVSHDYAQDVLVAPTPDKQDSTDAPFYELQGRRNEVLANRDLLVVIGFSFRDKELREIVKAKADAGMRVVCVSMKLDPWSAEFCRQLWVKDNRIEVMKGQERLSVHENMYAFESEFGPEQMDEILKVLEHVKQRTPAYSRER